MAVRNVASRNAAMDRLHPVWGGRWPALTYDWTHAATRLVLTIATDEALPSTPSDPYLNAVCWPDALDLASACVMDVTRDPAHAPLSAAASPGLQG